jgi:hypothetical protein
VVLAARAALGLAATACLFTGATGGLAFFDLLAHWREQGDFEGLILG